MKVKEFAESLNLKVLSGDVLMDKEVSGMYICDLLSFVMSHASKGDAWITVHTHLNIVAVALLLEISCVIIPEDISVEEATIKKAEQEGIIILGTSMNSYEISCKAFNLGI